MGEMAQCSFQPQQPLVCDTFKNCEGLSRVAFMDGNGVVMLGKVVSCERKEDRQQQVARRSEDLSNATTGSVAVLWARGKASQPQVFIVVQPIPGNSATRRIDA